MCVHEAGSSIRNLSVEGADGIMKSITDVMVVGDMILLGIDGWTSSTTIDAAYKLAEKYVLNTSLNAN